MKVATGGVCIRPRIKHCFPFTFSFFYFARRLSSLRGQLPSNVPLASQTYVTTGLEWIKSHQIPKILPKIRLIYIPLNG